MGSRDHPHPHQPPLPLPKVRARSWQLTPHGRASSKYVCSIHGPLMESRPGYLYSQMAQTSVGHQLRQMLSEQEHRGTRLIEIQEPTPPPAPRPREPPGTLTRRRGERPPLGPRRTQAERRAQLPSLEERTESRLFPAFLPRPRGGPSGGRFISSYFQPREKADGK